MADFLMRLVWYALATGLTAYAALLFVGNLIHRAVDRTDAPVIVIDDVYPGEHRLTGTIMMQSPCDELSVRAQAISTSSYMLLFSSWREPSIQCPEKLVPRTFYTQLFAPEQGIKIFAVFDGKPLPIFLMPAAKNIEPKKKILDL